VGTQGYPCLTGSLVLLVLNLGLHTVNLGLHVVNGIRRLHLKGDYLVVKGVLIRALVKRPSSEVPRGSRDADKIDIGCPRRGR
jgi:hypothetical protein